MRKAIGLSVVFTVAVLVSATPGWGQEFVEYSAKFVCGTPSAALVATGQIAAGTYATSINIHNPHESFFSSQTSTTFLKKAVLSMPEGVTPVPPSSLVTDTLPNDFAEEVDCKIIRTLLGPAGTPAFIEGFVIIIVPPTGSGTTSFTNVLDVVGVYSNAKGALEIHPANEHFFLPGTTKSGALHMEGAPKPVSAPGEDHDVTTTATTAAPKPEVELAKGQKTALERALSLLWAARFSAHSEIKLGTGNPFTRIQSHSRRA